MSLLLNYSNNLNNNNTNLLQNLLKIDYIIPLSHHSLIPNPNNDIIRKDNCRYKSFKRASKDTMSGITGKVRAIMLL